MRGLIPTGSVTQECCAVALEVLSLFSNDTTLREKELFTFWVLILSLRPSFPFHKSLQLAVSCPQNHPHAILQVGAFGIARAMKCASKGGRRSHTVKHFPASLSSDDLTVQGGRRCCEPGRLCQPGSARWSVVSVCCLVSLGKLTLVQFHSSRAGEPRCASAFFPSFPTAWQL